MMKRFAVAAVLVGLITSPAHADPKKEKKKDEPVIQALSNPTAGAAQIFSLSWTDACSTAGEGGPFFPTCTSALLTGYDNGWLQLDFWNRAGIDGTFSGTSMTAIGLGNVPCPSGERPTGWDAGLDGNQIGWSPDCDIPGPAGGDGFITTGNPEGLCSNLAVACPGGLTTVWGGSFGSGGGAVFYWFVGVDAINALDPSKITLELHSIAGEEGSTGYVCLADGQGTSTTIGNVTWECGDDPVDPPFETVPEPATMTLLATGLVGMAAARRKRSKQQS